MIGRRRVLVLRLEALEGSGDGRRSRVETGDRVMEFHVSRKARIDLDLQTSLFTSTGNVIIPDFREARVLAGASTSGWARPWCPRRPSVQAS